ncbi:S9 family peptidase [Micrococcales bacterium 31B]|nr:S9 family peptidase [Micrococcales bacterium 31B]
MTSPMPQAKQVRTERVHHGDTFIDNYEWLREKESPEVIAHLEAENAYTEAVTQHLQPVREAIFDEIKGRTQEDDLSVPSRRDGWWYFTRTVTGGAYGINCRVPAHDTGDELADWTPPTIAPGETLAGEQVIIDNNEAAAQHEFYSLGGLSISDSGRYAAIATDIVGDERYTIRVKDLETGEFLADEIENTSGGGVFSADAQDLYYVVNDESWRPYRAYRHRIGTPTSDDELLYEESDQGLWMGIGRSASKRYFEIHSGCSEFSETRLFSLAEGPVTAARVATPGPLNPVIDRSENVLYDVDDLPEREGRGAAFVLTHNHNALNSQVDLVLESELAKSVAEQQRAVLEAHRDDVRIEGAGCTRTWLAVSLRQNTCPQVRFYSVDEAWGLLENGTTGASALTPRQPRFDEEIYTSGVSGFEYESPLVRLSYSSWFTPSTVFDYFIDRDELALRKQTPVLGGYQPSDYVATRHWATAADGTRVPLSVLHRADLDVTKPQPTLVYAYGSYEISMDPALSVARLSLMDRGVIYVVAHVRGGGEMGRAWYENGKKLHKQNTFTDFVDATRYVLRAGLAEPGRVVAMGGSAGGLLMGAIANLAPELYAGVVAQVPFVDALTSILDPDLPLSALEWEEWGNPIESEEVYRYMKQYSPYENVRAAKYPRIAAVTSLHDTRVLYVEPAKWVALLRETAANPAEMLLKTEMHGGHGGASGRYERWKDIAWDYAFALDCMGLTE